MDGAASRLAFAPRGEQSLVAIQKLFADGPYGDNGRRKNNLTSLIIIDEVHNHLSGRELDSALGLR